MSTVLIDESAAEDALVVQRPLSNSMKDMYVDGRMHCK
jgi:hypothetical protein